MALLQILYSAGTKLAYAAVAIVSFHFIWYFYDPQRLRSIPGPWSAALSDFWMVRLSVNGKRISTVHDLHQKHGPFVRIAPNHVSISSPEALNPVYGYSSGTTKSDFYDTLNIVGKNIFSVRDRAEHTRKRKIHSRNFSQKSLLEYEPHMRVIIRQLVAQWDSLYEKGKKGDHGSEGKGGWYGESGRVWFDASGWYQFMALDIITSLAFGGAWGLMESGKGVARAIADSNMRLSGEKGERKFQEMPLAQTDDKAKYIAALSMMPMWFRRIIRVLMMRSKSRQSIMAFIRTAVAAVEARIAAPIDRRDLLSNLLEATDDKGERISQQEIISEAFILLVAGSETISSATSAITFYLAQNPAVQKKLQSELDGVLNTDDDPVARCDQVKNLTYFDAVLNEGLRIASSVAVGLPRMVPEGGLVILGRYFPAGTVVSVPTYTLHRDPTVWGDDVEVFRPER